MKIFADYLLLGFIRLLILVLEILPLKTAKAVALFYVNTIFLLSPRFPKAALRNLAIVFPNKSLEERTLIFKNSKSVLAENILGFARIPTLNKEIASSICDYSEVTRVMDKLRSESKGKGILIPTLHFDAFEFFVQTHALNYRPLSILGRSSGLKRFDSWWNGRRELFGNKIFDRSGGYKEVVKRLNAGEDVIVMCDQNVKKRHAIFAKFFGLEAATTKTIALAALRSGAPVLFGSPVQTEVGKFKVNLEVLPHPSSFSGNNDLKIKNFTEAMHRAFEQQILTRPEAWYWLHRRWKTRPEGEPENLYS